MIYLNSGIYWFCFQRVEPCQVDMGVAWWHLLRLRHFHSISETPFDSIFGVNRWCRGLIPQPVRYRISLITEWVAQSCTHVPPMVHSLYRFAWLFSGDIIQIFKNHQRMIPWSTWIRDLLILLAEGRALPSWFGSGMMTFFAAPTLS